MDSGDTKGNLGQMYAVGGMAFVLFLSTLAGVPVLPALSQELGAGATEIPIVVSAATITVVVAQFFSGILADRYSKRTLILAGALMGSVSSFLCLVATHWTQLAALRVFGGLADAIAMPALLAITATLGSEQPGRAFGILRSSQGLSFVIGPALGSALSLVSLRAPFAVDGVLSLFAFLVAFMLLRDMGQAQAEHDLNVFRALRSTFADKRVYLYLLMGISGLFGFGILYSFVATKAQIAGLKAWQIGSILSIGAVVFSLVSYAIGVLSDRFGRRGFAIVAQAIIVVAGLGLVWAEGYVGLLLFYGLFCIGETITFLLSSVYASQIFEEKRLGASMGAFDSVMDLSLFVGPVLAISAYRSSGKIAPVFLIAVLPAVLAFFGTIIWLPKESK